MDSDSSSSDIVETRVDQLGKKSSKSVKKKVTPPPKRKVAPPPEEIQTPPKQVIQTPPTPPTPKKEKTTKEEPNQWDVVLGVIQSMQEKLDKLQTASTPPQPPPRKKRKKALFPQKKRAPPTQTLPTPEPPIEISPPQQYSYQPQTTLQRRPALRIMY